jgi:putrescine aminotransferase
LKVKSRELITFEEAFASTRGQMIDKFSKYVSPIEASIFRLLDADKRYVKAEGTRLFDEHAKEYLDFTAGYGTLCLGHNPPEILTALQTAAVLPTVLSWYAGINPLIGALAENLHNLLPGNPDITSFGNGGVESVEIALKTARSFSGKKKVNIHGWIFSRSQLWWPIDYRPHIQKLL